MAKVRATRKKSKAGAAFRRAKGKAAKRKEIAVTLPLKETEPPVDIRAYAILVHGEKKIGKTSMFAQEEDAFFMEFDPIQPLRIKQVHVPDWPTYLAYLKALEDTVAKGKCPYKTVIVDGIDLMFRHCFKWSCKKMVIDHPSDETDYGKSWNTIKDNFRDGFLRLRNMEGIATRWICHSKWAKQEKRKGKDPITKLVPVLTGQAEEVLVGDIDVWAAYVYDGRRHVLVVKGDERTGAGHRIDHCFRTPEGEMVEEIYLGRSAAEAYSAFRDAFENRQLYVDIEEMLKLKKAKKPTRTTGSGEGRSTHRKVGMKARVRRR